MKLATHYIAVMTLLACLLICVPAPTFAQDNGSPRIELSKTQWNFDEVWQGNPKPKVEFTVKNTGNAPLTIKVESSCGCTFPTKPKSPLQPGESDSMTVTYDSVKRVGPTKQTVTLTTNDPQQPKVQFHVRGTVKPVYIVTPIKELSFGKLFPTSDVTKSVKITNQYTQPLKLKLDTDQDTGPFKLQLKELEPGQQYELVADLDPPLEVGIPHVEAKLESSLARLPEIRIMVYAAIQPPIAVNRKQLFWPAKVNTPITQTLKLTYATGMPVKLRTVQAIPDNIHIEVGDVIPAATEEDQPTQQLKVTFPPGSEIPDDITEARIEILTDAQDETYQKVIIPVRIIGRD